tara:strand:- start:206 stop:445 length:240 start_codon:yes stop_codon:yes gene_type:complete
MENFTVYFTNQIDRESKALEVFLKDELIAHAQLNLCSNMAHVQILEKQRKKLNDLSINGYDIEVAIEDREISHNRILIK